MESNSIYIGIALLFLVSVFVRIIPSIISLKISEEKIERIKNVLPTAVFINLIIYCFFQEASKSLWPSIISLLVMILIYRKLGLLISILISSSFYIFLSQKVF